MPKSFMQTPFWAKLKEEAGWKPYQVEDIWILQKNLPFGKNFLYCPEVEWDQIQNIQNFLTKIQKNIKKSSTLFFRLEILDEFDDIIIQKLKQFGFIKSFEEVQPEWRQIIDIAKSEEEILAQMKQKGRYNIRVAQKHGVMIERSENINEFYELFRETAKRDGFEIRPKQYFEKLRQILGGNDIAELWQARYNDKIIAALIVVFYDGVASYLYGASASEYRQVMAPYLLHWRVIQRAKERGCQAYDLLAVMPEDREEKKENRNHKYTGITRFKEQFGGRKKHIVGSYDLVFKPTWYKLFKIAEKYRRK